MKQRRAHGKWTKTPWSRAEDEALLEITLMPRAERHKLSPESELSHLARRLGRSYRACKIRRLKILKGASIGPEKPKEKIRNCKAWSEEEEIAVAKIPATPRGKRHLIERVDTEIHKFAERSGRSYRAVLAERVKLKRAGLMPEQVIIDDAGILARWRARAFSLVARGREALVALYGA